MKDYFKYFYVGFFLLVLYLSYLIVKPFIGAMVLGCIIAYVFYPVFEYLDKKVKNSTISAFIVSIFIIMLFSIPSFILIDNAGKESQYFYIRMKQRLATGKVIDINCMEGYDSIPCMITDRIQEWFENPTIKRYSDDILQKFSAYFLQEASQFVFRLPKILLDLFIAFFVSFYLFVDGKVWANRFKKLLPVNPKYQKSIYNRIDTITHGVIYGSLIIALIQGSLGAVGFLVFGVPSPILWGLVMSVFALIPFLGTPIIWGPAGLLLILDGLVAGHTNLVLKGVGLLIYGTLIISTIDNILKPKLIGEAARIHPVIVLVGVFGGLAFMGFTGFIVGPLILALLEAMLEVYEKEKRAVLK